MQANQQRQLVERLLDLARRGDVGMGERESRVPVEEYTDPERAIRELQLFRRLPAPFGHASQLREPGSFATHDALGVPILLTRDLEGTLRAFLNVCRHRGTRLVSEASGCRRSVVCPYHGWTYDLTGRLLRIPESEGFPSTDGERPGLVELPVRERFGAVWVGAEPAPAFDWDDWLAPFSADLDAFDLERHVVYRRVERRLSTNWKLIIDAFLEGYHIPQLHRDTLARFFKGLVTCMDTDGLHARIIGSRSELGDCTEHDRETWELRRYATPYYYRFPGTLLLFHPDFLSFIAVFPDGADHCRWLHEMWIPAERATEADAEHWRRSFTLIEETVFSKEDIATAESIQQGLRSGANTHLTLGRQEAMIAWFHERLGEQLA